eukprot:Gb_34110 [translate_table: standard]
MQELFKLAQVTHLKEKIDKMYNGERIHITENHFVLHITLRATKDIVINSDGKNLVQNVCTALNKINNFSYRVRSGVCVGTTMKTTLNAQTLRKWITSSLGPEVVAKHMVGLNTYLQLVKEFGIDPENAFVFWDWVGGRYSVCSVVGVFPLFLQHGFSNVSKFLEGAFSMDCHFHTTSIEGGTNSPVLLGLLNAWNVSFLEYLARAILPYCQALEKFAPHIQQLSMEGNRKGVPIDGIPLSYEAGEIDFGELGTNGQHRFY